MRILALTYGLASVLALPAHLFYEFLCKIAFLEKADICLKLIVCTRELHVSCMNYMLGNVKEAGERFVFHSLLYEDIKGERPAI